MAEQKIEFRKTRDFGEILNDTFLFIGLNFKPLLKSFFAICAIFMLSQAVFNGLYLSRFSSLWTNIVRGRSMGSPPLAGIFNFQYFMILLFGLLTFISMQVVIGVYIKYYIQNDGETPGIDDVWSLFKKYFLRVLLYSIPIGLTIFIGCFFCLVPGIYFWVVFVPFSMVVIMEDASLAETYQRCFELIKQNFWVSFGVYLVVYLIYYITAVLVILAISTIFKSLSSLANYNMNTTITMITSFLNIFSLCFYIIFFISAALNYFNLVEIKDGTGILNRIGNIGKDKSDLDDVEEQY